MHSASLPWRLAVDRMLGGIYPDGDGGGRGSEYQASLGTVLT